MCLRQVLTDLVICCFGYSTTYDPNEYRYHYPRETLTRIFGVPGRLHMFLEYDSDKYIYENDAGEFVREITIDDFNMALYYALTDVDL